MICRDCRAAADAAESSWHNGCSGCDCQHRPTQAELDRTAIEEKPLGIDPLSALVARYLRYEDCPKCGAETGIPCIDQRWPHWRRSTLKPHAERKRKAK